MFESTILSWSYIFDRFHEDSDDEDDDDFGLLDEVHQEEEEEELNPGRNAYISGYERAEAEIRGES